MRLSVKLLEALQDCIDTIKKLMKLMEQDMEDMPDCINGEILREYLRSTERAQEVVVSLLKSLQEILADR